MVDQTIMKSPSRIVSCYPLDNFSSGKGTHKPGKPEEKHIEVGNQILGESPSRTMSSETIGDVENQNAMTEAEPRRTSQSVKLPPHVKHLVYVASVPNILFLLVSAVIMVYHHFGHFRKFLLLTRKVQHQRRRNKMFLFLNGQFSVERPRHRHTL